MGFAEVLTLILVVLKLLELINWSWWLVLSPIIVEAVLVFCTLVGLGLLWWRTRC